MMACMGCGLDYAELKHLRSSRREVSLAMKRAEYERSLKKRSARFFARAVPVSHQASRPHRAARAATRTWVAKGEIECQSDMPTISMGRAGMQKPSVSSLLTYTSAASSSKLEEKQVDDNSDVETHISDGADLIQEFAISETTSPALSFSAVDDEMAQKLSQESELSLEDGTTEDGATASEVTSITCESPASDSAEACCPDVPQAEDTECAKMEEAVQKQEKAVPAIPATFMRETILREVVKQLKHQVREAEEQAKEAKVQAHRIMQEQDMQRRTEGLALKKRALQAEKQRAAQLRKQRNQAAHMQAMKEKADRQLQEAANIRDQAEIEAVSMRAQALAEATKTAQEEVEAQVKAQLAIAKAEADSLKQDSLELAEQAEKAKAEALARLQLAEEQAEKERAAATRAAVEAQAMHAEAERTAQEIRQKALEDAVALKVRCEVQMKQRMEVESRARQEAEAQRAKDEEESALRAKREAEAKAQREAATARKLAKEMEQQRARKFHKQAKQERCQEQMKSHMIDAMKKQIEEESRALKEKAMAEIAAMKAKANAEASAVTKKAEVLAKSIKQRAFEEVRELKQQAVMEQVAVQEQVSTCGPLEKPLDSEVEVERDDDDQEDWEVLPLQSAEAMQDADWDVVM